MRLVFNLLKIVIASFIYLHLSSFIIGIPFIPVFLVLFISDPFDIPAKVGLLLAIALSLAGLWLREKRSNKQEVYLIPFFSRYGFKPFNVNKFFWGSIRLYGLIIVFFLIVTFFAYIANSLPLKVQLTAYILLWIASIAFAFLWAREKFFKQKKARRSHDRRAE